VECELLSRSAHGLANEGHGSAGNRGETIVLFEQRDLLGRGAHPASVPNPRDVLGVGEAQVPQEVGDSTWMHLPRVEPDHAVDDRLHRSLAHHAKGSTSSGWLCLARSWSMNARAAVSCLASRSRTRCTPNSARKASTSERGRALSLATRSPATRGSMGPAALLDFLVAVEPLAPSSSLPVPMDLRSWGSAAAMRDRISSSSFSSGKML